MLDRVTFTDQQRAFLEQQHSAAMITYRPDGTTNTVRIGVALVDGRLWSSATQSRNRTEYLRKDPRASVFVSDNSYRWLTIDARVTLLEGPDAAELNLRLFRVMQGRPSGPLSWFGGEKDEPAFLATMAEEGRLIYQFEPVRAYGAV